MKQTWLLLKCSIIFSLFLFSCSLSDSEITEYPIRCKGVLKNNNCSGMLYCLNRTTYKVSEKRQEIIFWWPGIMEEPSRLVNCIVRDRKNWIGEYKDGSGKISMINGKISDPPSDPNELYVSKWRWWYANIMNGKDLPKSLLRFFG